MKSILIRVGLSIVGAIGLIWGIGWLWTRPERWNPKASTYRDHAQKLEADSSRWHRDSIAMHKVITVKDSQLVAVTTELRSALETGQIWKSKFSSQVMAADATVDRLTSRERELGYYKALLKNGTLAPSVPIESLKPDEPEVITAGAKTAAREAVATVTIDSMFQAIGALTVANKRLRSGIGIAIRGLSDLSTSARAKKKGGLWPFNAKRRKQLGAIAATGDSLRAKVDQTADIEKILDIEL